MINRAPHPGAARAFINWMLSREGHTIYSRTYLYQSAREDVPVDHLPPDQLRQAGIDYFVEDNEDFLLKQPEQAKLAKREGFYTVCLPN